MVDTENDLISRQDAIRWVKTECNPYGKPTLDFESGKKVIKHLKQMPSRLTEYKTFYGVPIKEAARIVQEYNAEPKTGKWVEVDCYESEKHSITDMRCSLCGKYASIVLPHRTRCVYNFCPNCGAKMRGEEE